MAIMDPSLLTATVFLRMIRSSMSSAPTTSVAIDVLYLRVTPYRGSHGEPAAIQVQVDRVDRLVL